MDYKKLFNRFHQFGGMRLLFEYTRVGALQPGIKAFFLCLLKRQSFKAIYPEVLNKIEPVLIKKYEYILRCKKEDERRKNLEQKHPKVIWWCWLQGFDNSPKIVKTCYWSLQRYLEEYEIKLIDAENWREYIEIPDYIVKKWEKNQIPPALFSDLLRLQLLIKYGGTWIDSTVLCTGCVNDNYLSANLCLFQYTPEGTTKDISISNWFISAHSNNEVLTAVRDMLYAYWKDYDCTLDYYIFHLFFAMVAKEYPEQVAAMPYGYSMNSLVLLCHLNEGFNQEKWNKLTSKVSFHKLAFRVPKELKKNTQNYYHYILNLYYHELTTN